MNRIKYFLTFMIMFLQISVPNASAQAPWELETKVGAVFSTSGDQWGSEVSVGLGYYRSQFGIQVSYGQGQTHGKFFLEKDLRNDKNLLVADRWLENYPLDRVPEAVDFGIKQYVPPSDYTNFRNLKLSLYRYFVIFDWFHFRLGGHVGVQKVRRTYSGQVTAHVDHGSGEFDALISNPLIQHWIDPQYGLDLNFDFFISDYISTGPYLTWNESDLGPFAMGVNVRFLIETGSEN